MKNGSLGTIERIEGGVLQVRLDGPADVRVAVDTKFYKYLDHGYATTVHKSQGTTVDRTYVLATPHFDRHTTYVAMSRHREAATVFYAADDFGGRGGRLDETEVQARFVDRLSRVQAKDLAHDYLEKEESLAVPEETPSVAAASAAKPSLEEIKRAGREQWRRERELKKHSGQELTSEEIQRRSRETWLKARAEVEKEAAAAAESLAPSSAATEAERLATLNSAQLRELITRIKPPTVARLVELEAGVVAARGETESLRNTAEQSLDAWRLAENEAGRWRQVHGVQARLHDAGVRKADYLVERDIAQAQAIHARDKAVKALKTAEQALQRLRAEAEQRLTRATAPAREKAAELEGLARAAHEREEREELVREFERLAKGRDAQRPEYRDTSEEWRATPKVLRDAIERYNRQAPEVQSEILKTMAVRPDAARVLGEAIRLWHEQVRNLDHGLGL